MEVWKFNIKGQKILKNKIKKKKVKAVFHKEESFRFTKSFS